MVCSVGSYRFYTPLGEKINEAEICKAMLELRGSILADVKDGFVAADLDTELKPQGVDLYVRGRTCSYRFGGITNEVLDKFILPPYGMGTRINSDLINHCLAPVDLGDPIPYVTGKFTGSGLTCNGKSGSEKSGVFTRRSVQGFHWFDVQ